jgi:DNA-binding NarL/FixJ family response regulator
MEGEAGLGKTSVLAEVRILALERGFEIIECAGVRDARSAGFAGLHQLLQTVLGHLDAVPHRQAGAIRTAFGMDDEGDVDRLLLGLGALGLLEEAAAELPLLVAVEDLHWLDSSSADVVGFLARRITGLPVLLVATARPGQGAIDFGPLFADHLPLTALSETDSLALIAQKSPALEPRLRDLIVSSSLGNPLALTEFAASASTDAAPARSADPLPLTGRLEQTFLSEIHELPDATRRALLVAAAGQGANLREVVTALAVLGLAERDFVPAERIRLIRLRDGEYDFRHPLVGSALYNASDSGSRADAHAALASSVTDPTRAAWHRAAAASGWDEGVARELDAAAETEERRGARIEAAAAWQRAADLSPVTADRAHRIALAAEVSRQAGAPDAAAALIAEAIPLAQGDEDVLRLARTEWMLSQTTAHQGRSARDLVELAAGLHDHDDRIEALVFAAVRAYILGEPAELRATIARELWQLDPGGEDVFQRIGLSLMEPGRGAGDVELALGAFEGRLRPTDSVLMNCLAFSAEEMNDLRAAEIVWNAATRAFHAAARTSDEATGLCGRGGLRIIAGHLTSGLADAEQALHLSTDLNLGIVGGMAAAFIARARAMRGEDTLAREALRVVLEQAGPQPFARIAATAAWATAQLAIDEGRPDVAIDELVKTRVNEPIALWAGGDFAELSARTGRRVELDEWLERADQALADTDSDHLRVIVERSRGLLGEGAEATAHFEAAIDAGIRAGSTVELAKARLYFGERLRRERRIVQARTELWEALRVFEAESIRPLVERASAELRAAGGVDSNRVGQTRVEADRLLTGQELVVAQLASEGLTNREIADQIYLSHRTVGAHLHRAFAKLGISRRSQLATVLAPNENG